MSNRSSHPDASRGNIPPRYRFPPPPPTTRTPRRPEGPRYPTTLFNGLLLPLHTEESLLRSIAGRWHDPTAAVSWSGILDDGARGRSQGLRAPSTPRRDGSDSEDERSGGIAGTGLSWQPRRGSIGSYYSCTNLSPSNPERHIPVAAVLAQLPNSPELRDLASAHARIMAAPGLDARARQRAWTDELANAGLGVFGNRERLPLVDENGRNLDYYDDNDDEDTSDGTTDRENDEKKKEKKKSDTLLYGRIRSDGAWRPGMPTAARAVFTPRTRETLSVVYHDKTQPRRPGAKWDPFSKANLRR